MKVTSLVVLSAIGAAQAQTDFSAAVESAISLASVGASAAGITGDALSSYLNVASSVIVGAEDKVTSIIAAQTITDASSLLSLVSSVSGEIVTQLESALTGASPLSDASSVASSISSEIESAGSSISSEASTMSESASKSASSASKSASSAASSASSAGNGVEWAVPASGVFGSFLLGLVAYL